MTIEDQVVLLGVPCQAPKLESEACFLGGRPVWIGDQPELCQICCSRCKSSEKVVFLFQSSTSYEEDFERVLYLFVCLKEQCLQSSDGWILLRSQVKRKPADEALVVKEQQDSWDEFHTVEELWNNEADVFSAESSSCDLEKLIEGWKDFSLSRNSKRRSLLSSKYGEYADSSTWNSTVLLPQVFLYTIEEPHTAEGYKADPHIQFLQEQFFQSDGKQRDDELGDEGAAFFAEIDKEEWKYYKRIERCPKQCIRYQFGGVPLFTPCSKWNSYTNGKIPRCQRCGSDRVFELQLMSQFLYFLKETSKKRNMQISCLDDTHLFMSLSTVLVFTCSKDCKAARESSDISISTYSREYVLPIFENVSPQVELLSKKNLPETH
jgi:pre-rRNA-processing protein TSR4